MKPSKIADKIVVGLYKQFLETGQNFSSAEAVVERFRMKPHVLYIPQFQCLTLTDCYRYSTRITSQQK